MQIDVGFSDVIVPPAITVDYPTILDMPEPRLRAYSYETLIAEKLQAMVFLGSINSRMKDFYDIWLLTQEATINGPALVEAIHRTFKNRRTVIPDNVPLPLSDAFAEDRQRQWRAFLGRGVIDVEESFAHVVAELREFLLPVLEEVRGGRDFTQIWEPGRHWTRV